MSRLSKPVATPARPAETAQSNTEIFDSARDHVRMILRDLVIEVRIGLHPWEQQSPQRLIVNVEAWAYAGGRYTDSDASRILDYDRIRDTICDEWPKRDHVKLLEPLAEELIELCFTHPTVEAARVRLEKPDVFPEARGAGIELYRRRPLATEKIG